MDPPMAGGVARDVSALRSLLIPSVLAIALFSPPVPVSSRTDGWIAILASVRSLSIALAVTLAVTSLGSLLLMRVPAEDSRPATLKLVSSFLIGGAVTGSGLLIAGMLGMFQTTTVRLILIAMSVAASLGRERSLLLWRRSFSEWAALFKGPLARLAGVVLMSIAFVFLLVSLGPTIGWDVAMYHLDLPREYLENGRVFLPDDNLHAAFVATPQMLNAVFLAASASPASATFHWVATSLLTVTLATGGALLFGRRAGILAALAMSSVPALHRLGSEAMTESVLSLAILTLVLWIASLDRDHISTPDLCITGLLASTAFLIKYQAIPYVVGALLAMALIHRRQLRSVGSRGWVLAAIASVALFTPLLLKNVLLIGSPLYPFFSDFRYPDWISNGVLNGNTAALNGPYGILASGREAFGFWDWIFAPEDLSVEAAARWTAFPIPFLLAPVAMFYMDKRRAALLSLPAVIGVASIVLVSPKTNTRYLLPALVLCALLIAVPTKALTRLWSGARIGVAAIAIGLLLVLPTFTIIAFEIVPSGRIDVAVGQLSYLEWAAQEDLAGRGAEKRLLDLNDLLVDELGRDGRALLLLDARGFLFDVPVIQDNLDSNWPMIHDAVGEECLKPNEFTHVVWNRDVFAYLTARGVPEELVRRDEFVEYARRCLIHVRTLPGFEVYEIPADSLSPRRDT